MARSRATSGAGPAIALRTIAIGSEGVELAAEGLDARLQRLGLAVAQVEDQPAHQADEHRHAEISQVGHCLLPAWAPTPPASAARTSWAAWASVPQPWPPSHDSFFQMGSVAFT